VAGQEFQYIQDILKEFYAPAIVNQVYHKAPLWAQIEKKETSMQGKRVTIPVQTAFTESVGARKANDYSLPTAGRNLFDQAYIYMKRNYGRIQVDGFSIESAQGKGGWVDIVSSETKGVSNAFAMDIDRQCMGRGDGVIGHVASVSTTAVTVDNPLGIVADTSNVAKWFRVGQVLDIYNGASVVYGGATALTVESISGAVVTMASTAASASDGHTIRRTLTYGTTEATAGEMMGLDGIIDSADTDLGDFEGIDRTANEIWQAYESNTSTVVSETAIQEALDAIDQRTDGEAVDLMLTTYAIRNKLIDLIRADRQIDTMDLKAGWKAIKYVGGAAGEIPIMVHKNCPLGYIYFIALPHLRFYTLRKLVWDNKGGGVVKPVAGYDAYEAWFKMYANLGCDCSNSMGKLTAVTTA
jgi:hypothetical protein